VPPVVVAVKVTTVPFVGAAGTNVKSTDRVEGEIVTVCDAVAVLEFASVTVSEMVKLPFVEYMVVKLALVPVAGFPPVVLQA